MAGAVKRYACEQTDADILVELDHDDVLLPDCLAEVAAAFATHQGAALVYSDFAQTSRSTRRRRGCRCPTTVSGS